MRLNHRIIRVALTSAFVSSTLAACGDDKGEDTSGSTGMATGPGQTTTTNPSGTTSDDPTTGPDTSGTTGPDPTEGTTGPEPTSGTTGEPGDPAIYELCKANDADQATLVEAQCKCQVEAGDYPDLASCVADSDTMPEAQDCTCMVYAQNPETKATLECVSAPQKAFIDCLMKAGCADQPALEKCYEAYFTVVIECPSTSDAVNNQVSIECLGETPFMCGSGEQIPEFAKCDFSIDCMDGSDEKDCENAFMCMNGTLIPLEFKCDGFLDCCEGDPECRDMSDEAGCPVFMCMNGDTIPEQFKCNGFPECMDESDEVGCPVFMCMNGDTVPEQAKCDGSPDCMDGSDEKDCPVFMCMSGETIPLEWKCDGEADCEDSSDEVGCL